MGNSVEYRVKNADKISAYMRAYYLAHSTRPKKIAGDVRQSKLCKKCGIEKPRSEFTARKTGDRIGHLSTYCRACMNATLKSKRIADPEKIGEISWKSKIKRLYGITVDHYNAMFERQNYCCAICESKVSWSRGYRHKTNGSSRFMVDHCHKTGVVRGLLCTRCNRAIGLLGDKVKTILKAAEYLKRFQKE